MSASIASSTHLFAPLTQRSITLRNRIVVSPMCQYSAEDGFASDWHLVHLGSRAVGGAGVVMTEAAAISPEGRISPGDLGIWKDEHVEMLARITAFLREQGAVPAIQLAHAGRKASMPAGWEKPTCVGPENGGWMNVVGPSDTPYGEAYARPHAMDRYAMEKVLADMTAAVKRAEAAGFLLIEIHGAHGYLLHEFVSPLSNTRTDEYGGSLENRMRFPLEVVRTARAAWPDHLPMWVRISASDWVDGGLTVEESIEYARRLKAEGAELIDVSSGGNDQRQQIPVGPGYQVHFAEQIRREAGVATGAVGLITGPTQADQILRSGQADVVLLARELLREPYWPLRAALELKQPGSWPKQYERAALGPVERRKPLDE